MLGDAAILEEAGTVYNKKDEKTGVKPAKGVAFPTCISINHCICHNSPIASDADIIVEAGTTTSTSFWTVSHGFSSSPPPHTRRVMWASCLSLLDAYWRLPSENYALFTSSGDLVKIDLGVHIDGYIAPCATTFIVGGGEITGRKADAIMAAYQAAEVALRMMRPGASVS